MIPYWIAASIPSLVYDTGGAKAGPPIRGVKHSISTGPIELKQANNRLVGYVWAAKYFSDTMDVNVCKASHDGATWLPDTYVATMPRPVASISLSFDQTGNVVLAIGFTDDTCAVFWFNPETEANELMELGVGSTPVVGIDNLRNTGAIDTELALFFVRAGTVYKRNQSDRWVSEHLVGITGRSVKLKSCGMRVDRRFRLKVAAAEIYTWPVALI